ncbi:MAG: hypothetical protein CMP59_13085 [Flavobacteriales bacterium]|mgnify:CR=1 FL=1|nr:hypothetical protein [Flavobacteriales bacterium]|tara:strand:- start:716 stop:1588 length:873 start_codon:yes stop_codon:yes gene_type:complete
MNPILRDYLYFSKAQRKALVLISFLILTLILFNKYAHLIFSDELEVEVDIIEAEYEQLITEKQESAPKELQNQIELIPFDPNEIDLKDWQALGLSESQARSILNYRKKGGSFIVKSDLKKMYVVSEERFQSWESYIKLPDIIEKEEGGKKEYTQAYKAVIIDLNLADSAELIQLKGIGPVYASRIVKFRNALGGFYNIDQLTEVWGIDDTLINTLRPQLSLGEPSIVKLRINHLEAAELKSHPYLNWSQANAIVNYRKQHGRFMRNEDLMKIYSIDDTLVEKISPYLKFD